MAQPPSPTPPATTLTAVDLGRDVPYPHALNLQRAVQQQVIDGHRGPTLLLLEHAPAVTLTRRPGVADHLLASPEQLATLGIAVHETDRGGDITYHGPGQLVAYPILPMRPLGLNLGRHMRLLEQAVVDTAARFGITAHTEQGATGVWVDTPTTGSLRDPGSNQPAKLCAMGVRIRRNTTMHGLALNVTTHLPHFDTIVPCGLHQRPVTSLHALLGDACPSMPQVKSALREQLAAATGLTPVAADPASLPDPSPIAPNP
ncbi:MAG: lipoyl(octanoyl) transferase LipB [Planctomycetota bacterium]